MAHWLAAYELVSGTVTPHPASVWAKGPERCRWPGRRSGLTDQVLDDEFPLSMFYEALEKKMRPVIESTAGITGRRTRARPAPHERRMSAGRTLDVAGRGRQRPVRRRRGPRPARRRRTQSSPSARTAARIEAAAAAGRQRRHAGSSATSPT